MDAQAVVWFLIAIVAAFAGIKLLYERFIAKKAAAVESRGGSTLFAICMLLFALGAFAAGLVSTN